MFAEYFFLFFLKDHRKEQYMQKYGTIVLDSFV